MTPVRVVLVDDDALVLQGLRLMLAGAPGIDVVGDADDGDGLVDLVREATPDVVLLDLRMPRLDGVAALRDLRRAPDVPQPAVIVLTTFDAEPVVLDAVRAGASGFLLKHTPPADIVRAIRSAADGEPTVSPAVLRRLIDHVADTSGDVGAARAGAGAATSGAATEAGADSLAPLTDRERQVAAAVAEGLGNAEIARRLYLSHGSVKAHISSALTKLGLENRTQLAIAAHTAGIAGTRPSAPPGPRAGPVI
ncbi:response regulator [Promicromonospora iranensis]|uniref:DNA-binding NarL/FixJ family response regulator n=1 Tax=Promicromonospora iranensis TaxID=1105144 RepID=A0ABU2CMW1_9MICO|nr:response regulator transcription factor [Promicromonospora iranensis]MDR7382685.1 DNA-binding NarL/FixJ family response regulator [Promicromonospora iranensis]